jgi:hypothetical protein
MSTVTMPRAHQAKMYVQYHFENVCWSEFLAFSLLTFLLYCRTVVLKLTHHIYISRMRMTADNGHFHSYPISYRY